MTDFAKILADLGFVKAEERSNGEWHTDTYSYSENGVELLQIETNTNGVATAYYLEAEYSWNRKASKNGVSFADWCKAEIEEAKEGHQTVRRVIALIEEQYAKSIFKTMHTHSFNLPQVHVGVQQGDDFFPLQKYSVGAYEQEIYVVSRMRGSNVSITLNIEDGTAYNQLEMWLQTPHLRSRVSKRNPYVRTIDGRNYHVFRSLDASKYLPAYRAAKSVKVIRENLLLSFATDEFDLFKELDLATELYEFVAYEV